MPPNTPEAWPKLEVPVRPPARPQVTEITQYYRFKRGITAGSISSVTGPIAQIVSEVYWKELGMRPVITGTTYGEAYEYDAEHLGGCAIDFRTWGISSAKQVDVSQHVAARVHAEIDEQVRVVLWLAHRTRPDHLHVTIQKCGQRGGGLRPMWSLNGK